MDPIEAIYRALIARDGTPEEKFDLMVRDAVGYPVDWKNMPIQ